MFLGYNIRRERTTRPNEQHFRCVFWRSRGQLQAPNPSAHNDGVRGFVSSFTLYRDNTSDSGTMVSLPIFSNSLLIIQTPDAAEDLSPDILSESLNALVINEMCECGIHWLLLQEWKEIHGYEEWWYRISKINYFKSIRMTFVWRV
jgi:hypothetical protein